MHLHEFQARISTIYGARDRQRGRDGTFRWFVEEVGELARALRDGDPAALQEEVADVLAWTVSVATLCGVDMEAAAARYADHCPRCGRVPCICSSESSA